jgi:hypothetical protein
MKSFLLILKEEKNGSRTACEIHAIATLVSSLASLLSAYNIWTQFLKGPTQGPTLPGLV